MKKIKASAGVVIAIVLAVVITAVVVGGGVYLWQKNKQLETALDSTGKTATVTAISSRAARTAATTQSATESPAQVTENFMKYTLGTLPGATLNYNLAKEYLSETLKVQYPDETTIPLFYGIQDGPTSATLVSENVSGNSAAVKYNVSWGEMGLGWGFNLINEDGGWKIDEFRNDAQ